MVFLGAGIVGFAQNPSRRPPAQPQDPTAADPASPGSQAADPLTITGCLMKGSASGEYALTDSKSGEKYSFAAPDKLQEYLNQTVQLTGTVSTRGGAKDFRPQSVKTVSSSCTSSQ